MQTLYGSYGLSELGNETINVNGDITVAEANAIDLLTTETVSASIASSETVSNLKTLTGNNAYLITIGTSDSTVKASDLNMINDLTTATVNASVVKSIMEHYK